MQPCPVDSPQNCHLTLENVERKMTLTTYKRPHFALQDRHFLRAVQALDLQYETLAFTRHENASTSDCAPKQMHVACPFHYCILLKRTNGTDSEKSGSRGPRI